MARVGAPANRSNQKVQLVSYYAYLSMKDILQPFQDRVAARVLVFLAV